MVREKTDLDALSNVLTSAVGETLQPAHVSLWLREPELLLMRSYGQEQVAYPNASFILSAVLRPWTASSENSGLGLSGCWRARRGAGRTSGVYLSQAGW